MQTSGVQLDEYARAVLENTQRRMPLLEKMLNEMNDRWNYEDCIYRFYHQSYKVYYMQALTVEATNLFEEIGKAAQIDGFMLNPFYRVIFGEGTGITFKKEHNNAWTQVTRPIVEAFLHAKYFVEMHVKYGRELSEPPQLMPSGWAALLYLYNIR